MYPYLKELNEVQREAVEQIAGPLLVIAGAGSGKTRVLTYRVAHMINKGIHPSSILALTFTNKAAKEMKDRIASIVGYKTARYLWMGTFHSIFAKILRIESKAIDYPTSFTIYDSQDSKNLIKSICKEFNLDQQVYKPNEILGRISFAKNNLVTANSYSNNQQIILADKQSRKPEIFRIYQAYERKCKTAGAMDFDDLLMKTNFLFDKFPEILDKYRDKFKYILVDEYQDTNFSQYLIIKKLADAHKNLCVVGDDAQSIYSFRGARIENILNFKKDYPQNKVYKLEQNYRSTKNIVDAANSVISKNKHQIKKNVFSEKETGNKIKIINAYTDYEEGYLIVNSINEIRFSEHDVYNDFAVLYRTNAQSRILEEALRKKNIPYRIYGGISFYQRKEIKDLVSYLRLAINPLDDEAFKRVINYPKRGIGDTSLDKIIQFSNENSISIWQSVLKLNKTSFGLSVAVVKKILSFVEMIYNFSNMVVNTDAYELARQIAVSSGILKDLHNDKSPEGVSRYENVQELLNGIKDFSIRAVEEDDEKSLVTLNEYIENVSLLTNDDKISDGDNDKVSLMTIHSAKGLEFKNVFLCGLEEELFPSKFSVSNISELEEERRLFYVAITRAEKNLFISFAKTRYKWGQLTSSSPSRFIKDIDGEFIDYQDIILQKEKFSNYKKDDNFDKIINQDKYTSFQIGKSQNSNLEKNRFKKISETKNQTENKSIPVYSDLNNLNINSIVEHSRFGKGKVLSIEGEFPNTKALIDFEINGKKQLLLKFAKLKVIKV
ncbi:MAG: UvrD-helicase domain-containing protein [Bacteroidales bacterium]|nr:UvrD-helicase domain-containing protein [Bacteroidales bacterium]